MGRDEIGGGEVGRGGGKMDGEELFVVLGEKIRIGWVTGCTGSNVSKAETE